MRKEITDRLKEVFTLAYRFHPDFVKEAHKAIDEDPEACLVSLLESLKEDLPKGYSTTNGSVEIAGYPSSIEEAKQILQGEEAPSAS